MRARNLGLLLTINPRCRIMCVYYNKSEIYLTTYWVLWEPKRHTMMVKATTNNFRGSRLTCWMKLKITFLKLSFDQELRVTV